MYRFDLKNASDHIFVITADQGRCQYEESDGSRRPHQAVRHAIFLQHCEATYRLVWNMTGVGNGIDRLMVFIDALQSVVLCIQPTCGMMICLHDGEGRWTI